MVSQTCSGGTRLDVAPAQDRADPRPPPAGDAVVAIVRSGPDLQGTERETIHRVFFAAITLARSRVYVTTPYFIPDRAIVVGLQTAALRGVDVKLLFPSRSNHPELAACFSADLAASSRIDLAEFRRRPRSMRVVEGAARLLSPLM
jgi:phosphatidylserine/phosphatidylglycerophosphate/cardiolipin synthase-like enzyme